MLLVASYGCRCCWVCCLCCFVAVVVVAVVFVGFVALVVVSCGSGSDVGCCVVAVGGENICIL